VEANDAIFPRPHGFVTLFRVLHKIDAVEAQALASLLFLNSDKNRGIFNQVIVMNDSLPIVAFQGEPGAYSEAAVLQFFDGQAQTIPCHSFEDAFESVEQGRSTHAVVPIENSLAGSIHRNYDLLVRQNLTIIGEHHLRVSHCLMALPGVTLDQVQRVYSHPQALSQCEHSLANLHLTSVPAADTAGSARMLRDTHDRASAALASHRAAQVYQLDILAEQMEDNPLNFTRFLILTCGIGKSRSSPQEAFKTSIVFSLSNTPGSLFKALSVFALRDIDLAKIESRPIAGKPWEYMFYIDFIGHAEDPVAVRALENLKELAPFLRILGSYPRHILSYPSPT
jgi:prephenate dehydratase